MTVKRLLHAGCGSKLNKVPREFAAYEEVRLDCAQAVAPDIVASIVAMPMIEDAAFDALYCSHTLEHLYAHEVAMALAEFQRILRPGATLLVVAPDLQSIGGKLALDQADFLVYQSPIGPVTALDMIYGMRSAIGAGNLFMGHKTGFTTSVLKNALDAAGFVKVEVSRDKPYELHAHAMKESKDASSERSAEALPERPLRPCVAEGTPLRQPGQAAGAGR